MHWVIQENIFRPENFAILVETLRSLDVEHSVVQVVEGDLRPMPSIAPHQRVYVCGAWKMAKIARREGWFPGTFLNDNFDCRLWKSALGDHLLNADMNFGTLADIEPPPGVTFFLRPVEDTKSFDGVVMDREMLQDWRGDSRKAWMQGLQVAASSVKSIQEEIRVFVVARKVVAASRYKVQGRPEVSGHLDPQVTEYVQHIVSVWTPADSFVVDVARTAQGLKVIEFNNINSSGFYAIDVAAYVRAIGEAYETSPR